MFQALPREFACRNAGVLRRQELASLMNEIDLFVDFSSFQAMGLAALEAMACGAAVIVPKNGGATSFARNDVNSLVIDTSTADSCRAALERLVGDRDLIARLGHRAMFDACQHHAERAAFRMLDNLFRYRSRAMKLYVLFEHGRDARPTAARTSAFAYRSLSGQRGRVAMDLGHEL